MFACKPQVLLTSVGLLALAFVTGPSYAQPSQAIVPDAAAWHSDQVMHLIGMPDVRAKEKGSLYISPSPAPLVFITAEGRTSIDRPRMLTVT